MTTLYAQSLEQLRNILETNPCLIGKLKVNFGGDYIENVISYDPNRVLLQENGKLVIKHRFQLDQYHQASIKLYQQLAA